MRTTWRVWAVFLAVTSVLFSVLLHDVGTLLFVTAVVSFLVGLVAWTVADGLGRSATGPCVRGALWGGVLGAASAGWGSLLGWSGGLVVMTAVLTYPDLVEVAVRAWHRRRPATSDVLHGVSDAELCRRWQETTPRLRRSGSRSSLADVVVVVEERARILDEVEARDPAGFDAWISSQAGWSPPR
jgi:hypothetical protein